MIVDFDDFGVNRVISDQTQSHDCHDKLDQLHYANPGFKVTLFAIPAEMTYGLAEWCKTNSEWVQLSVHGIFHTTNYECERMTYEEFDEHIKKLQPMIDNYFVKGFKAPGWQISDDIYRWLVDHDYWVADQGYNDGRRPEGLKAYVNYDGVFKANGKEVEAYHGHCWDTVGNGIYEDYQRIEGLVKNATEFKFISEVLA